MAGSKRGKGARRSRRQWDGNDDLIAAVGHPLRREILRRMSDGGRTSPGALARELDENLGNVAYHVRLLVRRGALRSAGGQRSGPAQHLYRWSVQAAWVRTMLDEE